MSNRILQYNILVDSFIESRKALVKQSMQVFMETMVDELFEDLANQAKEIFAQDEAKKVVMLLEARIKNEAAILEAPPRVKPQLIRDFRIPDERLPLKKRKIKITNILPATTSQTNLRRSGRTPVATVNYKEWIKNRSTSSHSSKKVKVEPEDDDDDDQDMKDANFTASPHLEGKHQCRVLNCGRRYKYRSDWLKHERIHSGIKPYGCSYPGCSYASSSRFNTLRHIENKHLANPTPSDEDGNSSEEEDQGDPTVYLTVDPSLL